MNVLLIKQPSALLPIAMSLGAIAMVLGHAAIFGVVPEADEGTAAHVFQRLLGAQVPAVALFAAKWLPRRPSQALRVVALQAFLGLPRVRARGPEVSRPMAPQGSEPRCNGPHDRAPGPR